MKERQRRMNCSGRGVAGGIGREPQDSPPGSDTRSGSGHGADFIQAGCKEGLGGCTS